MAATTGVTGEIAAAGTGTEDETRAEPADRGEVPRRLLNRSVADASLAASKLGPLGFL